LIFQNVGTTYIDTYPYPNREVLIADQTYLCFVGQLKRNNACIFLVGATPSNFKYSKLQDWAKTSDFVIVCGTLKSILENPTKHGLTLCYLQ
jgi:tRNA G37 N-methylase TrmD